MQMKTVNILNLTFSERGLYITFSSSSCVVREDVEVQERGEGVWCRFALSYICAPHEVEVLDIVILFIPRISFKVDVAAGKLEHHGHLGNCRFLPLKVVHVWFFP